MSEDDLIPVFVPALVAVLANAEHKKGSALSEEEVLKIRDGAACVMLPESAATELCRSRGYEDLDPSRCWEQWQIARVQLPQDDRKEPDE